MILPWVRVVLARSERERPGLPLPQPPGPDSRFRRVAVGTGVIVGVGNGVPPGVGLGVGTGVFVGVGIGVGVGGTLVYITVFEYTDSLPSPCWFFALTVNRYVVPTLKYFLGTTTESDPPCTFKLMFDG